MEELFLRFFESTITTSVIALALILLSPILNKAYAATWKTGAWLLLAFHLIVPLSPKFIAPIQIPVLDTQVAISQTSQTIQTLQDAQTTSISMQGPNTLNLIDIIAKVWIIGIIIFLLHQAISYYLYKKQIKRWSSPVSSEQITKTFDKVSQEMGIDNKVKVLISKKADSPMMIGFMQPMLLLPHENYTEPELPFIFKHELVHYKRHDIWYKAFLLLANAIHWYNPLIYIMFKEANKDLEFSCDEVMTKEVLKCLKKSLHSMTYYDKFYFNWAWDNVRGFMKLLRESTITAEGPYGNGLYSDAVKNAEVGNVLSVNWNGTANEDSMEHAMFVTEVTGTAGSRAKSNVKIAAHTRATNSAYQTLSSYTSVADANFGRTVIWKAYYLVEQP